MYIHTMYTCMYIHHTCQPSPFSRDYTGIYTSLPVSREFTSLSRFSSLSILSPRVWCFVLFSCVEILPKVRVMREAYVHSMQSAYTYTYVLYTILYARDYAGAPPIDGRLRNTHAQQFFNAAVCAIKGESREIATQIKGFYLLRLAGMIHTRAHRAHRHTCT